MSTKKSDYGKVTIEEAINIAGYGVHSYFHVVLTGAAIISYACLTYSTTIILPVSACELNTSSSQRSLIAAAPVTGLLLGAVPWGYLGDTRGRQKMLVLSLMLSSLLNIIATISINWIMLGIIELLISLLAAGQYMLAMTLLSECVPLLKRNLSLLLVASMYLLSQGIMAVIAIPVIPLTFSYYVPGLGIYWNSWRLLLLIYSIPPAITMAGYVFFIPESPSYIFVKGDEKKALSILKTIYRRNHWGSNEEFQVKGLIKEVQKETKKPSRKDQILPLFKKPLLKYTIIVTTLFMFLEASTFIIWFPTIVNQFMQISETGAPMNQTLCSLITADMDAPNAPELVPCSLNNAAMLIILATGSLESLFNLLISLVVNKVGRRNLIIVITAVCGLSGVLVNLVPNTVASGLLFIVFVLGSIMFGLYTAVAVALFPTNVRAVAVAWGVSGRRLAMIVSIQIVGYLLENNCDAAFYLYGAIFASSSLVSLFLPDDRLLMKAQEEKAKENKI